MDTGDELFRGDAFLFGAEHDRRAVGIVGAGIPAFIALHFLETDPDVGLDVFDQVAKVYGAVGVGQGGGDENFAGHGDSVAGGKTAILSECAPVPRFFVSVGSRFRLP